MNFLYSVEEDKNIWGYNSDVGIISKITSGSDYDAIQDQNIESNKQQITETKQSLTENEARDDEQQSQLDANDAFDRQQQREIEENNLRDDAQQSQIDETMRRLNDNIIEDERQQSEINANRENITRVEGELPTLNIEGTALVIGKRSDE